MPVNPINNYAVAGAAQEKLKKAGHSGQEDDVRRAASAVASQEVAREKETNAVAVKKVVEVQKKEGMSEARRTIDKFV